MKKVKVYIASPYTIGWQASNVQLQLEAKHILMDNGFIPFAPLENHFAEIYKHREEGEWLEWDLEWLKVCKALVRIKIYDKDHNEIPSSGADIEVKEAKKRKIPIYLFNDLKELREWAEDKKGIL